MPAAVIVVHDDPTMLEATLKALRDAGHDCAGFADPMAALDAVENESRLQVLATRLNFCPGKLNGLALARMLKFKQPAMHAVFAATPEDDLEEAAKTGRVLAEPLDPQELVEAVAELRSGS
jgi:DNA-binding NtrC family response regulator